MKKTYETFVDDIRKEIIETSGCQEDAVYLVKAEEEEPENSEQKKDRLCWDITKFHAGKMAFAIPAREMYQRYQEGAKVEDLVREIAAHVEMIRENDLMEELGDMEDYEKVRGQLILRLLNTEADQEKLRDAVYEQIEDVAVVLYAKLGTLNEGTVTMRIHKTFLEGWGKQKEEVFSQAMKNMMEYTPPRIYFLESLMMDLGYAGEDFLEDDVALDCSPMGNCLTTTERTYGAASVFVPGVAERLYHLFGGGFYLVFTSIHEVMIHREDGVESETLQKILTKTMNKSTPIGERLTSHIFHFDLDTRFTCAL